MPDQVIAWDSCILLDAIQKTDARWQSIAPMINLATRGDLKIVLSTISVTETYYLKELARAGLDQAGQDAAIESWLDHSFLVKRSADFGTCKIAAELCRQQQGKISPSDAIVVATAL